MSEIVPTESQSASPMHGEVRLIDLFLCFLKLGSTSFGGGTLGWTFREVVERRGWIGEEKFLQMLTIAQVMPGPNPVNIAVYVGLKLRGVAGSIVAAIGMVALPFCIVLCLGAIYQQLSGSTLFQTVLGGIACVAIAALLQTGLKGARRMKRHWAPIAVAAAVFILVGVLRQSMVLVVCCVVPVSIAIAYWLGDDE